MSNKKITINSHIAAEKKKVWDYYTQPTHITQWNFADPSWHCPVVSNNLKVGGKYFARMEAKDGSFGFDFEAHYTEVSNEEKFTYEFGGRTASVAFLSLDGITHVTISFDPEDENPIELQKQGWQAILNNFKNYCENN